MNNSQQFWRGLFFIFLIVALCGALVLPAFEGTPAHAAPQMQAVAAVTNVSSSTGNGVYTAGDTIDIEITFSDIVFVSGGVPTLLLETGIDNTAVFDTGSSSNTLKFKYTVAPGDTSTDLDYVATNSLILNGATITSISGNADLTLPSPSSAGSLGANQNIVIVPDDGLSPTVTVEQAIGQADPATSTPIIFTVAFSEPIDVSTFTVADITQSGNFVTWSITNSGDYKTFTLSAISVTQNNVVLKPSIAANRVQDLLGNNNSASISIDNSVTFNDITQPSVTVDQASGQADPTVTLPVNFTIVFFEPIHTGTFTVADITQNGTATGITWSITNPSGDQMTFTLSATAVTGVGTLVPSIAANRVTDLVGNSNLASTSTDNIVTYSANTPTPTRTPTRTRTPSLTPTKVRTKTPTPAPPPPLVAINEFVPRPGHDWNLDGVVNTNDEYIELLNHGVIDVNLSGYRLDDEANIGSDPYSLPSVVLKPGERIVFYGSETNLLLSDGGDGVRLLKPNGQLADAYNYFVVRFPDQSYCRLPDNGGLDDWNKNCFPTPGLPNSLGSSVNPPTTGGKEPLCPIADTLPDDFAFAECAPFGHNIWNSAYWDRFGWFDEQYLPESPGKWPVFAD